MKEAITPAKTKRGKTPEMERQEKRPDKVRTNRLRRNNQYGNQPGERRQKRPCEPTKPPSGGLGARTVLRAES